MCEINEETTNHLFLHLVFERDCQVCVTSGLVLAQHITLPIIILHELNSEENGIRRCVWVAM